MEKIFSAGPDIQKLYPFVILYSNDLVNKIKNRYILDPDIRQTVTDQGVVDLINFWVCFLNFPLSYSSFLDIFIFFVEELACEQNI